MYIGISKKLIDLTLVLQGVYLFLHFKIYAI